MSDYPAQIKFAETFCRWGLAAFARGYTWTFGDAYRDPRATFPYMGNPQRSFHPRRLAVDVNLFKDGVYIKDVTGWKELGELWEMLGGTWGGRWPGKKCDPNHLSWGER